VPRHTCAQSMAASAHETLQRHASLSRPGRDPRSTSMSASETIERVVHGDADVQIGQPRRRLSGLRSESGILPKDPFVSIDVDGVGALVKLAVERGRSTKANIKLGVCGEHGGDPDSIRFFREAGLNYVSCSPFRVTIARLAAAQAEVHITRKGRGAAVTGTA